MTQKRESLARSHAVKVGLTPATYEKLRFVSETLGMTPSAVAALAVSEYAAAKFISFNVAEKSSNQAIEAMVPHMAQLFQSLADKEQ